MLKYFTIVLMFLFSSCANSDNLQNNSNADTKQSEKKESFPKKELSIDKGEEEGWGADIRLSIVSGLETDSTRNFTAVSTYEGKDLGLLITVPKAKEGAKGFGKGIIFKSIGSESDYLLLTLAKLYKQKTDTSLRFASSVSVTYVNLKEFAKSIAGQEGQPHTTANEYKLFFEGSNDEDYAELYVNISPDEHWIELREKDEEYRPTIIKFLKK